MKVILLIFLISYLQSEKITTVNNKKVKCAKLKITFAEFIIQTYKKYYIDKHEDIDMFKFIRKLIIKISELDNACNDTHIDINAVNKCFDKLEIIKPYYDDFFQSLFQSAVFKDNYDESLAFVPLIIVKTKNIIKKC